VLGRHPYNRRPGFAPVAGDANVRLFSAGRKAWGWPAGRRGWGGAERGQKWRCRKDKGLHQVSLASA